MDKKIEIMGRREFLKNSSLLFLGAAMMTPVSLFSQTKTIESGATTQAFDFSPYDKLKTLELYNVNTQERLETVYFENGSYIENAITGINNIMGDRRSGKIANMDINLIDALYQIKTLCGVEEPINIICGYRSPETNERMHRSHRGVAHNSYHTKGQAVDISIKGAPLKRVQQIAESLKIGGVGYYPKSGFVHIDVGPIRYWRG
ncbi:MAG TPA: DUF882 domain-containing protein [Campylobacterales bacterium]|nr:DUF882 domain-containing protein [Campylobacterales bacterium]